MSIEKTRSGRTRERWPVKNFITDPPKDENYFLAIYTDYSYDILCQEERNGKKICIDEHGVAYENPDKWVVLPGNISDTPTKHKDHKLKAA